MGNSQSQKARGKLSPRDGIPYLTASSLSVANQVFLGSWTVDISQEGHSQRSAPQKRHTAHLSPCSCCTQETKWPGQGSDKRSRTWGECPRQASGHLSSSEETHSTPEPALPLHRGNRVAGTGGDKTLRTWGECPH